MAEQHSIPPFPDDIDRRDFGIFISGFTDGEGSFFLRYGKTVGKLPQPYAAFRIALRADDRPILELIQSYFGCGIMSHNSNTRSKIKNAKPVATYDVLRTDDLATIIVPHFERFPLWAKKQNDFRIWKEAVLLLATVKARPWTYKPGRAANRHGGCYPKWTTAEREHFHSLMMNLREQRGFTATPLPPKPLPTLEGERGLFD